MNPAFEKTIEYVSVPLFEWQIPHGIYSNLSKEEVCEICNSLKDKEIKKLRTEVAKLEKLVEFLRVEIKSLELKTALSEKAVPIKRIVNDFTSMPEGKKVWKKAWEERLYEWHKLINQGKMSRIKYYRLINGMDQKALAKKLGTAQPNISRIEKVGYNVPTKTLKQLSKIFGVRMEDLIGD